MVFQTKNEKNIAVAVVAENFAMHYVRLHRWASVYQVLGGEVFVGKGHPPCICRASQIAQEKLSAIYDIVSNIKYKSRGSYMKVMSFNTQHCLNYIERKIDFEIMAKTILDCGADVVGLNEMRGLGPDPEYAEQIEKLAKLTEMKYFYFAKAIDVPKKGPYGNAILSKIPIVNVKTVLIPDPERKAYSDHYETRCILRAELESGVTVLITHFGLNLDEQENAVETVIKTMTKKRCILMGDFNVVPEVPVLAPIKAKMKDTAEAFDMPKLSFPSDNPTKKIDYIFVSKDIEVEDADIPSIVASDHRPHIATLKI